MERHSEDYVPPVQLAESYNGASHETFTWSQSISDLDVVVNVPDCLTNPRDLTVDVSAKKIKIKARKSALQRDLEKLKGNEEWMIIFEGEFSFPTKKQECLWTLVPGKSVDIHLEKVKERWWESLIVGEDKIELSKIDCSRDLFELGEAEQTKIGELMWNHRQKLLTKNREFESKSHPDEWTTRRTEKPLQSDEGKK